MITQAPCCPSSSSPPIRLPHARSDPRPPPQPPPGPPPKDDLGTGGSVRLRTVCHLGTRSQFWVVLQQPRRVSYQSHRDAHTAGRPCGVNDLSSKSFRPGPVLSPQCTLPACGWPLGFWCFATSGTAECAPSVRRWHGSPELSEPWLPIRRRP